MKKHLYAAFFLLATANLFCQTISSVKAAAGLFIPTSGKTGTSTNLELIHKLDDKWSLYILAGYINWGRNSVGINYTTPPAETYSEDLHTMIPLCFGARVYLSRIKTLNIFANLEVGYSHLAYDSFENIVTWDDRHNRIISYYVDGSTRKRVIENLIEFGAGLGFINELSNNTSIILEVKRIMLTENFASLRNEFLVNMGILYNL